MPGSETLGLVVFSGGFDRVHYALVMASAAAATNRKVTLLFSGRAVRALARPDASGAPGWHGLDPADDGTPPAGRDAAFAARGLATMEELVEACAALGARFLVCDMALKAIGMTPGDLRGDVGATVGGVVGFLNDAPPGGGLLFV